MAQKDKVTPAVEEEIEVAPVEEEVEVAPEIEEEVEATPEAEEEAEVAPVDEEMKKAKEAMAASEDFSTYAKGFPAWDLVPPEGK